MHDVAYHSPTERIQVWLEASTLHLRFNNPARHNALSVDMWEAIPALLAQAKDDERVRLVVFSGAGEKAFVSGADISQFEDMRAAREAVSRYEQMAETALMSIYHFSKPTLAGWSSMKARLRPSALTTRRSTSRSPSTAIPASSSRRNAG